MKFTIIVLILSIASFSAAANSPHKDVIDCRTYPDVYKSDFYLEDKELSYRERIEVVVVELLRLDVSRKVAALSIVLPDDHHPSEGPRYKAQLSSYSDDSFFRQANCISSLFKQGDVIRLYKQDQSKGSYFNGYGLFRSGKLIAVTMIEGIQI
ncbi:hypothetical protein ACL7TT_17090 [Microbulbifer sp. 2304DJ12-6]|uniref:hypothetical protein n=1 Tax=Microbulbifer sp. 2304DJ12-6 TaxID=3233340 RepID=UPI0039B09B31